MSAPRSGVDCRAYKYLWMGERAMFDIAVAIVFASGAFGVHRMEERPLYEFKFMGLVRSGMVPFDVIKKLK